MLIMTLKIRVSLLLYVLTFWTECSPASCPRREDVVIINDPTYDELLPSTTPYKCDDITINKEYAYKQGSMRVKLATWCVPPEFCGGEVSGWIKGKHPKDNGETEGAKICVSGVEGCCMKEYDVEIIKCGGKYLYKYKNEIGCTPKIRMCTTRKQDFLETTACDNNPCQNEGTCILQPRNNYTCECNTGYTGKNCDTDIYPTPSNPCDTNPCQNGGTCSESEGEPRCSCLPLFSGDRCQNSLPTRASWSSSPSSAFPSSSSTSSSSSTTPSSSLSEEPATTSSTGAGSTVNPSFSASSSSALTSISSTSKTGSSSGSRNSSVPSTLTTIYNEPTPTNSLSSTPSGSSTSGNSELNSTSTISASITENVATTPSTELIQPTPSSTASTTEIATVSTTDTSASGGGTTPALTDETAAVSATDNFTSFGGTTGTQAMASTPGSGIVNSSSPSTTLIPSSASTALGRVDGGFSEWSAWSTCSKTCATGNQTRTRTCTNLAPANNGSSCNGSYTDTQQCNPQPCPINGGWTEWTAWSFCNKPCGNGSSERTRSCTNPTPMYGGMPCNGSGRQENVCHTYPCAAVIIQYVLRFTSEKFNANLQNKTSSEWNDMETKIKTNARKAYTINSNVVYIKVLSHRKGSVISTFNLSYSAIDSIQIVQLLESIRLDGVFGDLPARILAIIPDVVPIAAPTITYVSNSSSTSILLKWIKVSDASVIGYAVFYKEKGTKFLAENVKSTPATDKQKIVGGLKKYNNYSLVVLAFTSKGNGIPSAFVNASTDEDVPSKPPGSFQVVTKSSTSLLITWESIPQEFVHGIFLGYNVTYMKHDWDNAFIIKYKIIKPGTHELLLEDLAKYTIYSISAFGFTSKGSGVSTNVITAQTAEDIPTMPPQNFQAANLTSEKSITLSWDPVPREHINGVLIGYVIRYQQTSAADEKVTRDLLTRYITPDSRNIIFHGIPQYSVWKFQISAITNAGEGVSSTFTYGASCRCPKILYTNYFVHPPYLTKNKDSSFGGIFYNVTVKMIKWACGDCKNGHRKTDINLKSNGKGGQASKKGAIALINDIDDVPHISFPVYGNKYMDKYMGMYEYIHLMDSPGVAFISITDPAENAGQRVVSSVIGCFPLFIIALLMAILAGFVVWFLEFRTNAEQFSPSFFSGVWDGFWWAYVSMTTVGYGDRFTGSLTGRVFSIIWTLIGLVIISMLTGSIATALTSETVQRDIMLYGAKVAAVQNSTEHRIGILKNAKVNLEQQYKNFEELKQALKARKVQGILLDLLVAAENQENIFDSQIQVNKLLDMSFGYGIVLSGSAAVVRGRCRDYIKHNIADISKLIETKTKTIRTANEEEDSEEEVTMFDSNSDMFQGFLIVSCASLGCAFIAGFVWHLTCYLPKQREIHMIREDNNAVSYRDDLLREMNKMIQEFHQIQMKTLENMKERHKQEIRYLSSSRKKISREEKEFFD